MIHLLKEGSTCDSILLDGGGLMIQDNKHRREVETVTHVIFGGVIK